MRSWRSSSLRPAITSLTSSSVASSGVVTSVSRLASSMGFDPEAGSVSPSFMSIARALTMMSQTLSKAMSMAVPLSIDQRGQPAKPAAVRAAAAFGMLELKARRVPGGTRLHTPPLPNPPDPHVSCRHAHHPARRLQRVHDLRLVRPPEIQGGAALGGRAGELGHRLL